MFSSMHSDVTITTLRAPVLFFQGPDLGLGGLTLSEVLLLFRSNPRAPLKSGLLSECQRGELFQHHPRGLLCVIAYPKLVINGLTRVCHFSLQ